MGRVLSCLDPIMDDWIAHEFPGSPYDYPDEAEWLRAESYAQQELPRRRPGGYLGNRAWMRSRLRRATWKLTNG